MHYEIEGLCPVDHMSVGNHCFFITLYPEWRDLVERSVLTQEKIDAMLSARGRQWLDACGFDSIFDPDNCGFEADRSKGPGPNAYPTHRPLLDLRVAWGKWGPEHIQVPGNACGLDLDVGVPMAHRGARVLCPHNIDNWSQKNLLLMTFTHIASSMALMTVTE